MSIKYPERMFNFSAGPAVLPVPVLEEIQRDMVCMPGAGASILEISHRSPKFDEIIQTTEADLKKLLNIPDGYSVLFLQGGASTQFSMVPMNFLRGKSADYVNTGTWAKKAIKEAKREGGVNVIWTGEEEKFTRMPKMNELKTNPGAAYVHITSNETIEGIEWQTDPEFGDVPVVCDASSDILSRPVDVSMYDLIYAGAQKNAGPSGVTIVIVSNALMEKQCAENLPTMLDYKTHVENKSLYNTPPCIGIYIVGLVAKWLLNLGGLEGMYKINKEKAKKIYDVIDSSGGYYRGHAKPESRSIMNVTFRLPNEDLEKLFAKEAAANKLDGLKGHRSVGGLRASIYNAFPMEGIDALTAFMKDFQQKNG